MPQSGPGLWKTKRLCPRTEWASEEARPTRCSRRRCHPGAQGPVAEEQRAERHGCQRSSCGHGSGPTGNCLPEMPDCDQPRRAFPRILPGGKAWDDADAASMSGEAAVTSVFALHTQEQWFCAHAETRSALTQVVSQKWRKLHCRLLDNVPETKQSQASAQRRRCGESAHAFAVAFRRKVRRARSA